MDYESLKRELSDQQYRNEYAFNGMAVADIRRALVLGLCLASNARNLRDEQSIAREAGKPWPKACALTLYADDEIGEIANALLWIENAAPHKVGNMGADEGAQA